MIPWLALLVCLLLPASLSGQALRVQGQLDHPATRLLREILARDGYLLLTRDTVLPDTFRTDRDLVVVGAAVRLEGNVQGSVAVVSGELFVRPRAVIGGRIVAVQGEVYRSGLATMGDVLRLPTGATSRLNGSAGSWDLVLLPPPRPPALVLGGVFGVGLPTYDRVDGLSVRVGGSLNPTRDTLGPVLIAAASYHAARGDVGGRVALEHPLRPGLWIGGSVSRGTVTNEQWIRGDLENTLASLGLRSDARNYFQSDEVSVYLQARPRQGLMAGEGRILPRLALRASRDRSLAASDPWTVFGSGEWRENPEIDDGTIVSVAPGAVAEWRGQTTTFLADLALEWAPPGGGDFSFVQAVVSGQVAIQALWGHTAAVRFHTRQTLGSDPAPRQRWSFVGGSGTLPTLPVGGTLGDRLVFVRSSYDIPIQRIAIPLVGPPTLLLEQAIGTAWATGSEMERWEQNVGAGLGFRFLRAVVYVNPADGFRSPELNVSAALPF